MWVRERASNPVFEFIYYSMCEWITLWELEPQPPPQDPDLGPAIWTHSNTSTPSTDAGVLHFDQIKLGGLSELYLIFFLLMINLFFFKQRT